MHEAVERIGRQTFVLADFLCWSAIKWFGPVVFTKLDLHLVSKYQLGANSHLHIIISKVLNCQLFSSIVHFNVTKISDLLFSSSFGFKLLVY